MQRIGQSTPTLIPGGGEPAARSGVLAWGALGASAAAIPALWMWGFTVDDALISVRYARHVAEGIGWRFNAHGPSTDGATPLPWILLLVPFARAGALTVLARAKALGLCAWALTGAALGCSLGARAAPRWAKAAMLFAVGSSVPLAAYAVSGMETALATLAAACAALVRSPRVAAVLAGLAAAFRPEMAPWACVLAGALAIAEPRAPGGGSDPRARERRAIASSILCAALALFPFAACAMVRAWAWGRPAPLAVLAKPGDPTYGLAYAGAAYFVTIVPILVTAPLVLRRSARASAIVLAALAHACSVVAVGGDWMPYARLFVPVLPSLAIAAFLLSERAHPAATAARSLVAAALGIALVAHGGTSGRRVGADRRALVAAARPWLAGAVRVAAVDVGWVSAATEADIVDLAGVTDPEIAALPGGHTSKRVDGILLLDRAPDRLLLYAPRGLPGGGIDSWRHARFRGAVEARLARDDVVARHFAPVAWLPLGGTSGGYVVLARRDGPD